MAEKKKITIHPSFGGRKVISSKLPVKEAVPQVVEQQLKEQETVVEEGKRPARPAGGELRVKKVCFFCQNKSIPTYTDLVTLRRFLTDRAKILPKLRSGVCSKQQRAVTKNIKYARHLALLPFVPKV